MVSSKVVQEAPNDPNANVAQPGESEDETLEYDENYKVKMDMPKFPSSNADSARNSWNHRKISRSHQGHITPSAHRLLHDKPAVPG